MTLTTSSPPPHLICVTGDPGAGKSTWAARTAAYLGQLHSSVGDLLRVRRVLKSGEWGDEDEVRSIVDEVIGEMQGGPGAVLDGYPRKPHQLEYLLEQAAQGRLRFHLVWCTVEAEVAIEGYERRDYARCPKCGNYGLGAAFAGSVPCPCGGDFTHPGIREHYLARRARQAPSLDATLALALQRGVRVVQVHRAFAVAPSAFHVV